MFNPSAKEQRSFSSLSSTFIPEKPLVGPLEARLVFYFSRPKYHYGTGKNSNTKKINMPIWHNKRKDLDNLIKFVLDS
jgi:Holliday junction resolvase RusA-like endonuclease